ncbi:hypothetical protein [Xenorhabdus kozodoii]|uniref:Uncharacterized protein n=1 Tax=Xenorhabdus kozodoii TaxID=351676 RepID=A0A2D0KXX0_9GAMM|nr:hypothetical protein [Xenorhabdus kozodoii]PHM68145.1 hypothetical protein Xkoz_03736 [Xenorhabdus kozodoii]
MFDNAISKEDFLDLHTVLEAVMILGKMDNKRAKSIAQQLIELLSERAKEIGNAE